jgi:opacity protein-like surface antigen
MRKVLGVAAMLGLLGVGALQAQKLTFLVGGGLTLPQGDYGDVASTGFHGMGGVQFGLGTAPIMIRVEGQYNRTGLADAVGADGNTSIIGGMASVVYGFQTAGNIKPYILGGIGYFQEKVEITGLGDADESNIGYGGGVGVNIALTSVDLFVQARYLMVAEGDTFSAANFIPITVGVRFGGK